MVKYTIIISYKNIFNIDKFYSVHIGNNKRPELYALKMSNKYDPNSHGKNYKTCKSIHINFENMHCILINNYV